MSTIRPAVVRTHRRGGTSTWHMSRKAVSLSLSDVYRWTDRECLDFLVKVRFGSWDTVSCPHCNTTTRHYWRRLENRWKCRGCGSCFSVTSGTVFARRKKSYQDIIANVLLWVNSAAGQPALELKRHVNTTYNTVYVMQHKMREAMVRGYNVGLLSGDLEADGAHQSGWRSAEKRGKPQGSRPVDASTELQKLNAAMLTQTGKSAAKKIKKPVGAVDPDFGRELPPDRRILLSLRKRTGVRGKGACATRVAISVAETAPVAGVLMKRFVAMSESCLNTDSSHAYIDVGKKFRVHRTVEHAKELVGPNGENNNQAEELNARFNRMEKGIHLNIEPKYLLDYAAETAFRSDTRRLPNGRQLELAMNLALSVGESEFWKGFTHGHHRTVELTLPAPQPAPASGPAKGRHPISSANGRPPR